MNPLVFLLFLLSACTPQIVNKPVPVSVSVPVACKVPAVSRPDLAINHIGASNTLFEQVRAILATDQQRRAYEAELEAANAFCQ